MVYNENNSIIFYFIGDNKNDKKYNYYIYINAFNFVM